MISVKEKMIKFQTPFPAKLRVFFPDAIRVYNTAEEATKDLADRGFPITVIQPPGTLMERIQRLTWRTAGKKNGTRSHQRQAKLQGKAPVF